MNPGNADPDAADWLAASGLPVRWRGVASWTVIDTGFGDGSRFQALRSSWLSDRHACASLAYWAFVPHAGQVPPQAQRAGATPPRPGGEVDALPGPGLLPGIQVLHFDEGRVWLYLAVGPLDTMAAERVAAADVFWISDASHLGAVGVTALTRRRRQDARVVVGGAQAPTLRAALQAAGFQPEPDDASTGLVGYRLRPSLAPLAQDRRWTPLVRKSIASAATRAGPLTGQRIAVVGAGLAGCASARSLAELGAQVHLVDRHDRPASETSGNPAGLVHSVFHHPDTPHSRLLRAAASRAARDGGLDRGSAGGLPGSGRGLIQLQPGSSLAELAAAQRASGLPGWHIEALDADTAAQACGLSALAREGMPAWRFADGGWVDPAALCRRWIDPDAGAPASLRWHGQVAVAALERAGGRWRLRLEAGDSSDAALDALFDGVVVAAAGAESVRLLAPHGDAASWPLEPVRGQLGLWNAGTAGVRSPRTAVSGQGYAIGLPDGRVLVGATSQPGSTDLLPWEEDDLRLRQIAERLGVLESGDPNACPAAPAATESPRPQATRVGVRWRTPDRLPIVGPVADPEATGRADQCRYVSRVPGLYAFTALGSRGIAWARFGADLLASGMAGLPAPVESSLLDRLDPARFRVAKARSRTRRPSVK